MSDSLNTLVIFLIMFLVLALPALGIFHIAKLLSKKYYSAKNSDKGNKIINKIRNAFLQIEKLIPLPKPTEASLFVSSIALILIALTYVEFWQEIAYIGEGKNGGKWYLILLYACFGAFYSIYHAFSKKVKTQSEESALRFFSVITLILASLSSAVYIFNSKEYGFIFFSAVNLLHALKLFIFSGKDSLGDKIKISTRQAERKEIYLAAVIVLAVFSVEKYIYNTHWSILFSSVLFFWSIIGQFIHTEDSQENK